MSIQHFLKNLQQRVQRLRKSIQQSQQGRLRVMNLEDRRLLDATAGFLAGQLMLDSFGANDSLSISNHTDGHLDFDLTTGTWDTPTGGGLSLLNGDQTLRLDAGSVASLTELDINASGTNLNAVTSLASLNLQDLTINEGGTVQLANTTVSNDADLSGNQIVDSAGSAIDIIGTATLTANTITLGDDASDTTNFGSVTFVSTGTVNITEDSATEFSGGNSASVLMLTSSGTVTNADGATLNVTGAATLSGSSITVDDSGGATSNFGSVAFTSAGDVQIVEASDLNVDTNSSGQNVTLAANGNLTTSAGVTVSADSLSLTATESVTAGEIGSSGQDFSFDADSITTESSGDQFLAATGATEISQLQAVDSSAAFDSMGGLATIHLNAGEFSSNGTGIVGGLNVSDGVKLESDGTLTNLDLGTTSEVTFHIESTAGASGGTVTGFDQWSVSGTTTLDGTLIVSDQNLLANGTSITLIDSAGGAVTGTFAGLAEGATVTGTSGQRYQLSYVGGDVTLTALTTTFAFSSTTETVAENEATAQKLITVTRTGDASTADSIDITVLGGTATAGTDFGNADPLTASFAAGVTSTTVAIDITNDDVVEADETLTLTLDTPSNGLVSTTANATTLTITNDDVTALTFVATPTAITEGDSGTVTFTIDVTSSLAVDGSFTVGVSAIDGTAVAASDYTLNTDTLTFAGTATDTQTITVDIDTETTFEADETFQLQLGTVAPSNAGIDETTGFTTAANHIVTITNDDTPTLAVLDSSGNLTITDETVAGVDNYWGLWFDNTTSEVVLTSNIPDLGTGTATALQTLRFAPAGITGEIRFEGRDGNDLLVVDYGNGDPIPGTGLVFVGGGPITAPGDGMALIGDGALDVTYTPDASTFGNGQIVVGSDTINFEGLEPLDFSNFAVATVNLPGADDVLTVEDSTDFFFGGSTAALRVSGTSDSGAPGPTQIETAAFWNNDVLVIDTVAGGSDGVDLITINSADSAHTNESIQINTGSTAGDVVQINGNVAVTGSFDVTSETVAINAASITSGTTQSYNGIVELQSSTTLQTTQPGGTVTFASTVDSQASETNVLDITGNAMFNGDVGATQPLQALTVSGTSQIGGNVTTVSQQSYTGAATLASNVELTSTSNGSLTFGSTLDGAFDLVLNTEGTTSLSGAVGSLAALQSLTTNSGGATTVSGGEVTTSGTQTYGDSLVLTADTRLTASEVQLLGGAGGNQALDIDANLDLQSNINQVTTLTVTGTSTLDGDVTSTGEQDFRDTVTLAAAVALRTTGTSAAGANVVLRNVNAAGNDLTIDGGSSGTVTADTVSNVGDLTIEDSGSTTIAGEVTANEITITDTSGAVTFNGNVTATSLSTTANGYSVELLEDTIITDAVTFTNTGGVTFGDGTDDVQTFNGGVVSTASTTTVQGTVATSGDNLTLGTTTLADATTLQTGGGAGDITVGRIAGAGVDLTANAGTGAIDLSHTANVIEDLQLTGGSATVSEADNVTQSAAWNIAGATSVSAGTNAITLTNAANQFGDLTLNGGDINVVEQNDTTIADVTGTGTVQLSSGGTITVQNTVSTNGGDVSLTTTGTGDVLLEGVVTATGAVNINSGGSIQGDAGNTDPDIVGSTANLTAANGIGTVNPLETDVSTLSVTNNGTAPTAISNASALSLGATMVNADFELCVSSGDLTITGPLNASGHDVRLQADTGQVRQTAAGEILADLLGVNAATGIELSVAANNVDQFAATSAARNVEFTDTDGFTVTTATAAGCFNAATGVTAFDDGAIDLTAEAGLLVVNENVTSTSGNVSLEGDSVQQDAAISTGGTGTVSVTADNGDLTMSGSATTVSSTGTVTLSATNDVALTSVTSTSGALAVTADSDTDNVGAITDGNVAGVNLTTTGNTTLSAGTGIDVDTNIPNLTANVTGTGNIDINEVDALTLTDVQTSDGTIDVVSGEDLTATSVQAGDDSSDSVSLRATMGTLTATDVTATGTVTLQTDFGEINIGSVTSTLANVTVNAIDGDVNLDAVTADTVGATVSITSTGNIADTNGASGISATGGTVTLNAFSIGTADTDLFKPAFASDPIEIAAAQLNATATGTSPEGVVAIDLTQDTNIGTLVADRVFLNSIAEINLSTATTTVNSLSLISTGSIVLPATLTVAQDLHIEGADVTATPVIDLNANRILFVSGAAAQLQITAAEFDGETNGALAVMSDSASLQLTDLNCDFTAINTNSNIATISQANGTVTQLLPADANQNSRILSDQLSLTGAATFELTNTTNDVNTLAADNDGAITYADLDDLAVGTVNSVVGIISNGNNVLLDTGTTLTLQNLVDTGAADVRLRTGRSMGAGGISQDSVGVITAGNLGVRNEGTDGSIILAADNDVDIFAASNSAAGGEVVINDVDEITIGSVTAVSIPDAEFTATTGIQTSDGNVTIAGGPSTATSVQLDEAVNAGNGTVRILANGDVAQSADGTITADALGVRQEAMLSGNVILDDANAVNTLAIQNDAAGGTVGFNNTQPLTIGSVASATYPAGGTANAIQFSQTDGVSTDNGTVQIHVDGPATTDGSLQINEAINAGTAGVALQTDGAIAQTGGGAITAADLLIHQTAEAAGQDVSLGADANDVDNLAVQNLSEDGDTLFNDSDDLTIAEVGVPDVENLSTLTVTGLQADNADINITSTGDLNVTEDIEAASDTSTTPMDQTITLISRDGNFTLSDNTVISTDEDRTPGSFVDTTGDEIHILAGINGTAGIVDLGDPATVEIRTDGGVAKQIAPRPSGFTSAPTTGAETAFVTLTDAENSRQNLTFQNGGFLGELEYIFGIAGEENLEVVVDWGVITLTDPNFNGVAGDAVQQPSGTFEFSAADRDKSIFFIDEGGERYELEHIYQPADLVTTTNDRNGREINPNIIGVRFSVAQHSSINIWGNGAVDPTTSGVETAAAFTGMTSTITDATGAIVTSAGRALLSSTDTNDLRNIQAEASSQFPLANANNTPTGRPEGLAEWEFIAGPTPGIALFQPTERFVSEIPEIVTPVETTVISEISGDAFFGDGAASDGGVGTDVYLQIRRYFELDAEAEVVIPRINDSDLLASREAFEEFVEDNPVIQDGAGYEVWLVTETGGQRVERPVVQFEVTGGRPGPATEALPEAGQTEQLMELDFEQPGEKASDDLPDEDPELKTDEEDNEQNKARQDDEVPQTDSREEASEKPQQPPVANPVEQQQTSMEHLAPDADEAAEDVASVESAEATESAAVAGIGVLSFSAVSRFRSKRSETPSELSTTSRTIRSLRQK